MSKLRGARVRLEAMFTSLVLVMAVLAQVGAPTSDPVEAADVGVSVAFVAGNRVPPPADRPLVERLEAGGASVTVIDDDDAAGTDYSEFDLIFLSTSVTLHKIGGHFRAVEIPMVTNEQYLLDDNAMASAPVGKVSTKLIRIVDPGHELAAGLTGAVSIATAETPLGFATPGPGAEMIAQYRNRNVYFAYRTDAEMVDGATAPARRVFFPGAYATPTMANSAYFDLFDAAIAWALDSGNQPPVANDDAAFTDEDTLLNGGPDVTLLAALGGRGTEPGQFAFPMGVAVDNNDNIIVADTRNHRVQICTPAGDCTTFGSQGTGLGQFDNPSDVAVDNSGNIVVADTDNHRVQICTPAGACTAFGSEGEGPGLFRWPVGVAVDGDGNIVVVDGNAQWVQTCSPNGDCTTFGEGGSGLGQFSSPNGLAVDGDGHILVAEADNDRVQICSPTGDCSTIGEFGSEPGQFRSPWDVDVDGDGNIIVGDYDNNRVQICSSADCIAFGGDGPGPGGTEPGQFASPFGVAVDSHGNVVVADGGNDRIQVFTRGGVLVNDTDPDGDPLSVIAFDATSTLGADVVVLPDGTYMYDPTGAAALQALDTGDRTDDTFSYTIGDGRGGTATATVTITVAGLDDVPTPGPTGLFVAGSMKPPPGDLQIVGLIEAAGVDLTLVDDDSNLAAIDPTAFDVVFISSSVVPNKVGATFSEAPVPVVIWEGFLFDDMRMADPSGETRHTRTSITITDPSHPIAEGLAAGDHIVQTPTQKLSSGVLANAPGAPTGAQIIAHEPSHPENAVLFAYGKGQRLRHSGTAPALRVGLFPTYQTALTDVGEALITSTIDWVLAGGPPANDDFADAFIATPSTHLGSNRSASAEPGEPLPTVGSPGNSAWWTWIADRDVEVAVSTAGSSFDTVLAIWQGDELDELTLVAENDDSDGMASEVRFTPTVGQSYHIAVYGASGAAGDIQLTIDPFTVWVIGPGGQGNALAIRADGTPIISSANGTLSVTSCDDPTCSTATFTDLDTLDGIFGQAETSIAVGPDGNPIIAYNEPYDETIGSIVTVHNLFKLATCTDPTCAAATITTIDDRGNPGGEMSLTIGSNGFPVVAYYHAGGVKIATCDNAACTAPSIETIAANGDSPAVTIGDDTNPVVAFNGNDDDLVVAHCNDATCTSFTTSVLDSNGRVGRDPSIVIGSDGRPVIAYEDFTTSSLKVATCTDVVCTAATVRTVDDPYDSGTDSSVSIGADGNPIISYAKNGHPRFAACDQPDCTTANVTIVESPLSVFDNTSLAITPAGDPVFSFRGDGSLRIAWR